MDTVPQPTPRLLRRLHRLNQGSEMGFETVAEHVKNRGLKILLKAHAYQRAQFAADLLDVMQSLGVTPPGRRSVLAAIHRGWIDIKAAMTIGRASVEQVVLSECVRGDTVALRAYRDALRTPLPDEVHRLLQRQAAEIEQAKTLFQRLVGTADDQLVVQLFDSSGAAHQAISTLADAGISQEQIRLEDLAQVAQAYECHCQRQRVLESGITGVLLGLSAGALLGVLIGLSSLVGGSVALMWETLATTTSTGLLGGGLLGGLIGLFVGQATTEDDAYLYHQSLQQGETLVTVETSRARAWEVRKLLSATHRRGMAKA